MIKAEGEVGFGHRNELAFLSIPAGNGTPRPHAKHQRLLRQWNRGGPGESERAEVGHGGDRAARRSWRQATLARQLHKFGIATDQFLQRVLLRLTQHWNEHAI